MTARNSYFICALCSFSFQIVRRYDVIYIQEIRDSGGKTVVPTLLREVNR